MSRAPAPAQVHPTAVVSPDAVLGPGVQVGPYAVLGDRVRLGPGVQIGSHAVVDGHTELAEDVRVFPFAAIGLEPQDRKHDGSVTRLRVGARTVLREYVTVHPASQRDGMTEVGPDCLLMAYCHVAHDCRVGAGVVMANGAQLAGHCVIEAGAVLGGATLVHQFVRIGRLAITGAGSRVVQDVPPFLLADGHPARLVGLNRVGLERSGVPRAVRAQLKNAYRRLFREGRPWSQALGALEAAPACEEVRQLCAFLRATERGVTRGRRRP